MKKVKKQNNKKASERAFEDAFGREFDIATAEMFDSDKEQFAIALTNDGVKEFYRKVAKRFCAIVVSEVFTGGNNNVKG